MKNLFEHKKLFGMIHTLASPGTPKNNYSVKEIIVQAKKEAKILKDSGMHGIIIENMHDIPYLNRTTGHEVSTLLSIICYEVKNQTQLPVGLQILAGANKQAIAAAKSAGIDFIRAEGFVFSHIADEGMFNSDAGEILRYRKSIGADDVLVFTDIKKKHSSHAITNDISIAETAKAAAFFLSDGVIVTGKETGKPADIEELKEVRSSVKIPVLIGSGITSQNISDYINLADGFIVGSYIKKSGNWENNPDPKRIKKLVLEFEKLV